MTVSRRRFLGATAAASLAAGCGNDVSVPRTVAVGVIDDPSSMQDGLVTVPGRLLPPVGGAVTLELPPLSASSSRAWAPPPDGRILLLRATPSLFTAVQSRCPHAGCPLGYNPHDTREGNPYGQVECPCHASRFRAVADPHDGTRCEGLVLHLPSLYSLLAWTVVFDGKQVTIDLTQRIPCNNPFPAPVQGVVTLPLGQFPQLNAPGGSVTGQPQGFADTLIVARVDTTTVAALSAVCTHLGCIVGYVADAQQIACPCHQSLFALDGTVLAPPASSPLRSYQTTLLSNAVLISVE